MFNDTHTHEHTRARARMHAHIASRNIIVEHWTSHLDPETDESKYYVIGDVKAGILAYQLLELLRQSNVLKTSSNKLWCEAQQTPPLLPPSE